MRTYYNELFYDNGQLLYAGTGYDDSYGYFQFHGKGKQYTEDGTLLYEGDFRDDERTGKGKLYREDGTLLYEGDFRDNEPTGKGKGYKKDGTLFYEGDFRDGELTGKGKLYLEDGTLFYEGDFRDDERTGKGKEYYEDGTLRYEGDFREGYWTGKGKLYNEDGTLFYEGDFRECMPAGKGKQYNEDGTLFYEGDFRDGEPIGNIPAAVQAKSPKRGLDDCIQELNSMIGLSEVKKKVYSLINLIRLQNERRERNLPVMPMSFHLAFLGNPGTGKTTVARLLSQIYANLGIVSKGTLVETDRAGLVAGYLGQTALKTDEVIKRARGGVLFIDEAYSLAQDRRDEYGSEAIDCIMKRMEDYRDDLVVIVAGYQEPMKRFLEANPGLKSRFSQQILFENYSLSELMEILDQFCIKNGYTIQSECRNLFIKKLEEQMSNQTFMETFSNGRYIRNLFEKLVLAQGNRLSQTDIGVMSDDALSEVALQDLQYIITNQEFEKTF